MKTFNRFLLLIVFTVIFLLATNLVYSAQDYRISTGQTTTINEHGTCQKVTNNCGDDVFVPTATSGEWSDFRSNKPSCVSLSSCCTANNYRSCYNNNAYWYDSCGNRGSLYQDCGGGYCNSYGSWYCSDGSTRKRDRTCYNRGCSGSSCYSNAYTDSQTESCGSGMKCQNGGCVNEGYSECRVSNSVYHKYWMHTHTPSEWDNVCKSDHGNDWEIVDNVKLWESELSGFYLWQTLKNGGATVCYNDWVYCGNPLGYNYRGYYLSGSGYFKMKYYIWDKDSYCGCKVRDCYSGWPFLLIDWPYDFPCIHHGGWGEYYSDDMWEFSRVYRGETQWWNHDCNRDPNYSHIICCR